VGANRLVGVEPKQELVESFQRGIESVNAASLGDEFGEQLFGVGINNSFVWLAGGSLGRQECRCLVGKRLRRGGVE
jgi:hypothetical protein